MPTLPHMWIFIYIQQLMSTSATPDQNKRNPLQLHICICSCRQCTFCIRDVWFSFIRFRSVPVRLVSFDRFGTRPSASSHHSGLRGWNIGKISIFWVKMIPWSWLRAHWKCITKLITAIKEYFKKFYFWEAGSKLPYLGITGQKHIFGYVLV